ncbi:hypothetical protein AB0D38_08670 [Streptomyces sp. NPDC048279]|uniref:hypothetical protein n=1 Tax=Streptomyces sp. NPDC048279 TaxID=3154714 RepID=UPI0034171120
MIIDAAELDATPCPVGSTGSPSVRAVGGVSAADEAMSDTAMPLFTTDDVTRRFACAVKALKAKQPRPAVDFEGR